MNSRRVVGGLIRFGLVILTFALVFVWIKRKIPSHDHVRVETQAPPDSLGPGDMRLYNADSSVDVVLVGDKIEAGLSAKTVNKVKGELEASRSKDTSGLGGMIGQIVKTSVAGAIGPMPYSRSPRSRTSTTPTGEFTCSGTMAAIATCSTTRP